MTEKQALTLAKQQGATHKTKLPNGSFIAYRPSKAAITINMIHGAEPYATEQSFRYGSMYFASANGFYVPGDEWLLCREMHPNAEVMA